MNWALLNILTLSLSFMLVFTAFQTTGMLEESVLEAAQNDTGQDFTGAGYKSLSIIYLVFAVFNWISPMIVALLGAKVSMIASALIYNAFCASFLRPALWSLYLGSVLLGIAAAVIWTAQGAFLTANSSSETMGRNSGLFWAIFQTSLLWGNLYVTLSFSGKPEISSDDRWKLFLILTIVGCCGSAFMLLFRSRTAQSDDDDIDASVNADLATLDRPSASSIVVNTLRQSVQLLRDTPMQLLISTFIYSGLELTFMSGVYGTMLHHTRQLVTADPVVLLGYLVHTCTFYLAFVNLPMDSPIRDTSGRIYFLQANPAAALVGAFLLGFGDACYNTQLISVLGCVYPSQSAPAFALFKFFQSAAASIAFFYSTYLLMQWQLLLLVVFGCFGTISFFACEQRFRNTASIGYSVID
uniref:UNC93-like protein MFSD11 n=1 Tax=Macrostomum lignano TaxID=282301 RepID=A0A1I8HVK7_9PLAT